VTSKSAAKRRSDFYKIMATVRYWLWDDGLGEKTHKQCVGVQLSEIWSLSLLCRCNQEYVVFLLEEREREIVKLRYQKRLIYLSLDATGEYNEKLRKL